VIIDVGSRFENKVATVHTHIFVGDYIHCNADGKDEPVSHHQSISVPTACTLLFELGNRRVNIAVRILVAGTHARTSSTEKAPTS